MSTITPVHCYRCQRQYAANLNSLDTKCPECGSDSFAKVRPPSTDTPTPDPDLPGDGTFQPTGPSAEVVINGMSAVAMTIGPEAQSAIHHNRLRYAELQKARLGLPNRYAESRYRQ